MQGPDLGQGQLDVLALEGDPGLSEGPQLVRVVVEHLALDRVVPIVVGVDEDSRNASLESVLGGEEVVELVLPPLLRDRGDGGQPELGVLGVVVPVRGRENGVFPEVVPEHFLHEPDHASQRVSHPVVLLLECDDEGVNELDLVPQDVDETLDGPLLLHQVVAEPRRVDDREVREGRVAQKRALVLAGLLRHRRFARLESEDLEAAVVEPVTFVVLVAAQQDVGKAGLADTGGALESGKRKSGSKFQLG